MKYHLIAFYLEYRNDFLSAERYAEWKGMDVDQTIRLLNLGKELLEENASLFKLTGTNYFSGYVKRNKLEQYERFI